MSRCGLIAVAALSLVTAQVRAAAWSGSYVADGRCYCSGTLDPALAKKIVPTPVGGQSVASVCERIGTGPGPATSDARAGREVYTDPQCGHGPFPMSTDDANGGCDEGKPADECRSAARSAGPRWDLDTAYSRRAAQAAEEVARQMDPAGTIGLPAVPPVLAAGLPVARTVSVDGRRWQLAPPGTPEKGEPGSRIILNGRLYLAMRDVVPGAATRGVDAALERLRERREALIERARERIRDREAMRHATTAAGETATVPSASDSPTVPERASGTRPNP